MHVSAFLSKLVSGLLAASVSPWSWSGEPCPGLVTRPEPRQEPWNIKWAQELAREVREADAGKAGFWTSFGRIFPSLIWVGRKSTIIYNLIISSAKAPKIAKLFEAQGLQLIFYGDSITEQWRGTDQGGICTRCIGDSAIFDQYFGSKYRSLVLAVGGDQIGHLQWRLTHGDIPKKHHPTAAVIMIGTNDLGAVSGCSGGDPEELLKAAEGVKSRINETLGLLRKKMPETQLLMLGILPRGDGTNSSTTYTWPGIYTRAIHAVNEWLVSTAEEVDKISYLDCGPMLLYNGKISPAFQVDGLHPSPIGMLTMARCISPMLDEIMRQGLPIQAESIFVDSGELPKHLPGRKIGESLQL